ncbi:MFS transporter [Georgenia sp. SYP-B2076]|uniref:MFS transporter n=1 Tax=Georgenia sp. SYP-B2076 TaxID=2495881 RepID=UPI000F8D375C|nr:MFS transporter [Georgenia sp. SYP-B2076]
MTDLTLSPAALPSNPAGVEESVARPRVGVLPVVILIAAACMPILGSTSIAPLQPSMIAAFPDQPGAEVLVAMSLTVPALVMGLTAFTIGRFMDAIGRKRVLVAALFLYAFFGTMPLYLHDLPLILGSRVVVGITEAAIFAGVTTILADYFTGGRRARYFGIQNIATCLSAVVFIALAGVLGSGNWRIPFWMYTIAVVLGVLAWAFLPVTGGERVKRVKLSPVDWKLLRNPVLFTIAAGIAFYIPVGLLSFKLDTIGVVSTAVIGGLSAIAAFATAIGAGSYASILKRRPNVLLLAGFGLLGIGLPLLGLGESIPVVATGAVIANIGGGLLIPTLQNWSVQSVPFEQRGRAAGWFTSSFFAGHFIGPVLIVGLSTTIPIGVPIAIFGAAALVIAVIGRLTVRLRPNEEVAA